MKKTLLFAFLIPGLAMAQKAKPKTTVAAKPVANILKTKTDSLSYALGVYMANNFKSLGIDSLNYNLVTTALQDMLKNRGRKLDDQQVSTCINNKYMEFMSKSASKEIEAGKKFLEENKKRPGVITTASGLQYEIITAGTGPKPTADDQVVAHYRGTLIDGKEFDNSYSRGEPLTIPVGGVIKGWTEALLLMPKGSKWKLYIPYDLGYGERGAGQDIPGGAALIFEIELIDIKAK